jgi:hypothetical protein
MSKSNYLIDSKDKNVLSKGAKLFHFLFGLLLIVSSLIQLNKSLKGNEFDISFYSNLLILLVGVLWIIRGFVGRDFMSIRKYISLSDDSINIKKPFKKELQLSKTTIELITIKPTNLDLKTKDSIIDFDLSWITYNELQQLREKISEFGELNQIEIK